MQFRHLLRGLLYISIGWFTSCSTTINRQGEQVSIDQFDSLRTTYYHLSDSLNYAWTTLQQSDAQKLQYLDQIIRELTTNKIIDSDTLVLLDQMIHNLRELQFDSVTVANTQQIHQYDSLTAVVSDSLLSFADQAMTATDNPRLVYLADKVISENSSVVLYRLRYDKMSQAFNHFIEENKELMSSLDSTGRPVFKRPMFKLVNDPSAESGLK